MRTILADSEIGQVSAELAQCGPASNVLAHVLVRVVDQDAGPLPMLAIAQSGGALDWLADEPDLYADADVAQREGCGVVSKQFRNPG